MISMNRDTQLLVGVSLLVAVMSISRFEVCSFQGFAVDGSTYSAVPGASVTVINEGSGKKCAAVTERSGSFLCSGLLPGSYTIQIQAPGFLPAERKGIVIAFGEHLTIGTVALKSSR